MEIITITDQSRPLFEGLAPEGFFERFSTGMKAIGAVVEQEGERYAAGLLIFQSRKTLGNSRQPVLNLEWLYVAEEFRYQEVGDALLYELFQIAEKSGCRSLSCSMKEEYLTPEESVDLANYLEQHCFTQKNGPRLEIRTTLGEIEEKCTLFKKEMGTQNMQPLSVVPKSMMNQIFDDINAEQNSRFRRGFLGSLGEYDMDLSCVAVKNNQMSACFLIRKDDGKGVLEPMVLINHEASQPLLLLRVIKYSLEAALEKYDRSRKVDIRCCSNTVEQLVKYCFPDFDYFASTEYVADWDEFYEEVEEKSLTSE